jgi:hypothetical protein
MKLRVLTWLIVGAAVLIGPSEGWAPTGREWVLVRLGSAVVG